MDSQDQTLKSLRVVGKIVGYTHRGIFSPREAVDKIADELAYYRLGDLAEAVLPLLTPELVAELRAWVGEVMHPGYRYESVGLGVAPPEDDRLQMQVELVSLASRFARLGMTPAEDGPSTLAVDA
ncbi:hypothetical protein V5E97_24920 [Singulisphaera sp. Ch08]|uniref:Uncharacterized protein n=1 Tax=Singulisphaera sp. Ch08 TaxID=3120278 RepID=A0AAU7C8K8_9BACT